MRLREKLYLTVLGSTLCIPCPAREPAEASDAAYSTITNRNVFALQSPAPVRPQDKPPIPKITLIGITTILGRKQALIIRPLTVQREPLEGDAHMLSEGESIDEITVVAIDEKAGTVRVKNHGLLEMLTFEQRASTPAASRRTIPTDQQNTSETLGRKVGSDLHVIPVNSRSVAEQATPLR